MPVWQAMVAPLESEIWKCGSTIFDAAARPAQTKDEDEVVVPEKSNTHEYHHKVCMQVQPSSQVFKLESFSEKSGS